MPDPMDGADLSAKLVGMKFRLEVALSNDNPDDARGLARDIGVVLLDLIEALSERERQKVR